MFDTLLHLSRMIKESPVLFWTVFFLAHFLFLAIVPVLGRHLRRELRFLNQWLNSAWEDE